MRIGIDARLIEAFGIGSYIRGLLGGLDALGGDDEYVVFVPSAARHRIPPRFESVIADVPPYSIRELPLMGRLASRARLDLLHVPHFLVPWTRLPVVTTLFDAIPFHYPLPNPIAAPYIAWMMQRAASRAARILTISHAAKDDLLGALDMASEKIVVAQIGIDEKFFGRAEARPAFRYFLFSGRVAAHKNVETLLAAFEIVRRRDPELQLVLAGGKHEPFRGRPGVVVPGFVPEEELVALYRGALAVIMPSFMEGFGLPAAEAMAVGTPAITSTARALVEVTGDAALHVDPRSVEELADAMGRLASEPELRAALGVRGRERARQFTWARCAEQTRAVYREVLRIAS
jgi:glycosyltransferase involved in cell wall biosynthesis